MALEKWHQELKYNPSVGGKCLQRLDVSIANVIECLRLKFLRRLVSLSRNRIPHKLHELRKRHKIADQIINETDIFEETPNTKWLVASSKNKNSTQFLHFYTVKLESVPGDTCNCNLKCFNCNTCIHMFSCDCHDFCIQFNMCKHIHLICKKYPRQINCNNTADCNTSLEEHSFISSQLEGKEKNNNLEVRKQKIKDKINDLTLAINKCYSEEAISHIEKNINMLLLSIQVLANQNPKLDSKEQAPPNKNIKRQLRSFEKIKKRKKSKAQHLNSSEVDETLPLCFQ